MSDVIFVIFLFNILVIQILCNTDALCCVDDREPLDAETCA
jgi:hypothetical protein